MLQVTPLTPILGARITGLDIASGVDGPMMTALRDALDLFSVLVFPDHADDRCAHAFMSAIALAAIVIFWINES